MASVTAPETPSAGGRGLYALCFTRAGAELAALGRGLTEDAELRAIELEGVAAVVCDVPLDEWTGARGEANLRDLAWLGPRALRHEQIIEQLMRASPVLPLRFGSLFSSAEQLTSLLSRDHARIARFLDDAEGREEWSLRGLLDVEACEQAIFAGDARAAKLPSSPGARYLMEQKLRKDAAHARRAWTKAAEDEVAQAIEGFAIERRALLAAPRQDGGRTLEGVIHWALLLPRGAEGELARRLDDLAARLSSHGLRLEAHGPWPLYNFAPPLEEPPSASEPPDG